MKKFIFFQKFPTFFHFAAHKKFLKRDIKIILFLLFSHVSPLQTYIVFIVITIKLIPPEAVEVEKIYFFLGQKNLDITYQLITQPVSVLSLPKFIGMMGPTFAID